MGRYTGRPLRRQVVVDHVKHDLGAAIWLEDNDQQLLAIRRSCLIRFSRARPSAMRRC
jgi:hypothetical protein